MLHKTPLIKDTFLSGATSSSNRVGAKLIISDSRHAANGQRTVNKPLRLTSRKRKGRFEMWRRFGPSSNDLAEQEAPGSASSSFKSVCCNGFAKHGKDQLTYRCS